MNFNTELKRYYAQKRMDPERLERLVRTATARRTPMWMQVSRIAAAGLLLIALGWVLNRPASPTTDGFDMTLASSIAKHVVFYHEEPMPLNVKTDNLATISMEMPRLTFVPATSAHVDSSNYHLYGARYCHIQGDLALHMRLLRDDGQSVTLYQVPDKPQFDSVDGATIEMNGYTVKIWRENGVLMCLAEKIAIDV
jgi:hypothetical protein